MDAHYDPAHDEFRPRVPLSVSTDGERLRYSGLQNCGSPRCPRCAPVRGIQLSERVGLVLDAARSKGLYVQFVTLTARHTIRTRLADMRVALGDVYRRCWDGKGMARLKREGLLGGVRVWETTDGPKTGWHLHAHVLVISETAENCEEAAQHLKSRWVDLLAKRGWKSSLQVQDSRPVTEGFQQLGAYGAEDLKGWGIAAEMAGEWLKTGKRPDRLSVPELLALAHVGDEWGARRYAEAVEALAGQRMFVLGPKLKRLLGLDQVQDLTEETKTPDLVPDDWREMGRVEGEVWGAIGAEKRPAAARLIYRKGLKEGEPWPVVVRRLGRLRGDRRDRLPGGVNDPMMILRRLLQRSVRL
ncbi:protein rep [Acetobacter malorum]|uniref:protein rep n=1 Tax=Acetobacter malorum TaxID=178901 RepID=UPI0018D2CF21